MIFYGEKEKVVFPAHPCLTNSRGDSSIQGVINVSSNHCLFTMYVCRVTLVTPDLQFMFAVPLTLGCLEKRSSDNGHGTRRWTTPGSLVFGFFRG